MKKVLLFSLLISNPVLAEVQNPFPDNPRIDPCVSGVPGRLAAWRGTHSAGLTSGSGPENGITAQCNGNDPNCKITYVDLMYLIKDIDTGGALETIRCGDWISTQNYPGLASSLTDTTANNTCSDTIASGSIIDYGKKVVIESIPISGTGFELNFASEYNSKSTVNKILNADFSNATVTQYPGSGTGHVFQIENAGRIVYSNFLNQAFKFQEMKYIWDGVSGVFAESQFIDRTVFKVSVYRRPNFNELSGDIIDESKPKDELGCQFTSVTPPIYTCPPQISVAWDFLIFTALKSIGVYKPETYGLNGWTLSNHHYFSKQLGALFKGSGFKIDNKSFKTINHPVYGQVDLVIEGNAGQEIYIFDHQGKHLETRHAIMDFPIYKFLYEGNKLVGVFDRFNKETKIVFDINQKLEKIIAPYGQETNISVINNRIGVVTDPMGNTYEMQYDAKDQLTSFKSINGVETIFSYNEFGELTQEGKNTGQLQFFTEGFIDYFKENVHHLFYGIAKKVQISYIGRSKETVVKDGEDREVLRRKSTTYQDEYYQSDQSTIRGNTHLTERIQASNSMWGDDYNPRTEQQLSIDESGHYITQGMSSHEYRTYLDENNPLSIIKTIINKGINRRYAVSEVDPVEKKIAFTNFDSKITKSSYNTFGQITRIEPPDQFAIDISYNSNSQLSRIQKGTQSETFNYNEKGLLASTTNSKNQTTSYIYNNNSYLIEKTLPNLDKIKFERSANGEITKITAPNNQVHNFQLSLGDFLQNYLNSDNKQTTFIYDADKRLTKTIKPSDKEITYNYKSQSADLESITTPDGTIHINDIDAQGRLKNITSADNIQTDITWVANQVQQQTWRDTDGALIGTLSNTFQNDELRLQAITLNNQQIASYQYHLTGQVAGINVNGRGFQYQYAFNNTSSTTYILSANLVYYYINQDTLEGDKPTQIVSGMGIEDPNNQIFITMKRSFDNFGQASDYSMLTINNSTGVLNSFYELTPQYDENNRLIQVQRLRKNYIDNQVVSTTDFFNNYNFPLGSNNNLKEFNQVPTINSNPQRRTIASHSPDDKLLFLRGSMHRDYTYTADGDLESMTNCYGKTEFEYDVFSNLKKVKMPDGKIIEYKVDGMNRRIKKLVNGVTKEYYLWYDQIHLAAILDENKNPKLTYIYGPESNSPSYVIKNGTTYRILHDPGLGSIRYVIDPATTQIAQDIEYDEYGNIMKNTNPDFQPLTYAGGLYDSDTKLIRFGARDYDPTIGRWTTKDPSGFNGGTTNLYEYGNSNPMSYIDPDGEFAVPALIAVGAFIGAYLMPTPTDTSITPLEEGGRILGGAAMGAAAVGTASMAYYGSEITIGAWRFAPFGNRTGHPTGRFPHYHRQGINPKTSEPYPSQGMRRHRPWDVKPDDKNFCDRF